MIKHQLKIIVSKGSGDGEPVNIAEFKTMPLFKRLSSKWFGKVMVIVPDKTVQSVQINEVPCDVTVDTRVRNHLIISHW